MATVGVRLCAATSGQDGVAVIAEGATLRAASSITKCRCEFFAESVTSSRRNGRCSRPSGTCSLPTRQRPPLRDLLRNPIERPGAA